MKKSEVTQLAAMLASAYPHTKFDELSSAAYELALDDIDHEHARQAVRLLLQTCKFMPTIAEIREAVVRVRYGDPRPGGDAWGDVVAAMKRYGSYRMPPVDFQFPDAIVAQCVQAMGWRELCQSTNAVADRARFIELYDNWNRTERTRAQIAPGAESRTLGTSTAAQLMTQVTKLIGAGS